MRLLPAINAAFMAIICLINVVWFTLRDGS